MAYLNGNSGLISLMEFILTIPSQGLINTQYNSRVIRLDIGYLCVTRLFDLTCTVVINATSKLYSKYSTYCLWYTRRIKSCKIGRYTGANAMIWYRNIISTDSKYIDKDR